VTILRNLYSDNPGRRGAQAVVDLLVLLWVVTWGVIGHLVRTGMQTLAQSGYAVHDRAEGAASRLDAAQDAANRIPLVGDRLGTPFSATSEAVRSLGDSGNGFGDWFSQWAWPLGLAVVIVPLMAVVPLWLLLRVRFARRARAARQLAILPGGPRLLAFRALATHPVEVLTKLGPDPLTAFEQGHPGAIDGLARLELAACGVRFDGALPALGR
jgi:hypothetical protein